MNILIDGIISFLNNSEMGIKAKKSGEREIIVNHSKYGEYSFEVVGSSVEGAIVLKGSTPDDRKYKKIEYKTDDLGDYTLDEVESGFNLMIGPENTVFNENLTDILIQNGFIIIKDKNPYSQEITNVATKILDDKNIVKLGIFREKENTLYIEGENLWKVFSEREVDSIIDRLESIAN